MAKNKILLAGAALAASSFQAFAAAPPTTPPAEATALPFAVAGPTGLTAMDLIVGRDGTVAVDVRAREVKVASCSNNSCQYCNSGSC